MSLRWRRSEKRWSLRFIKATKIGKAGNSFPTLSWLREPIRRLSHVNSSNLPGIKIRKVISILQDRALITFIQTNSPSSSLKYSSIPCQLVKMSKATPQAASRTRMKWIDHLLPNGMKSKVKSSLKSIKETAQLLNLTATMTSTTIFYKIQTRWRISQSLVDLDAPLTLWRSRCTILTFQSKILTLSTKRNLAKFTKSSIKSEYSITRIPELWILVKN